MQPNQSRRIVFVIALAVVALGAAALLVSLAYLLLRTQSASTLDDAITEATDGRRFDFIQFEAAHLPNRLLADVARWFGEPEGDEADTLDRWFAFRNDHDRQAAEHLLERQLTESIARLNLRTSLPLFNDVQVAWPPADVEFDEPLRVLAISPRSEVRLVRSVLLTADVERDAFERIEAIVEADGEWSAWVTPIGGVALYPAPIVASRDYLRTLQIMGHEWTHHYLAFHPLGLSYGNGSDMRAINETVADIVGDELGEAAATLWEPSIETVDNSEWGAVRSETDPILRALRLDVDELLREGKVGAAERRMEAVRLQLIDLGRPFRKINQAFLAFRGGYGASPSSASEWGHRLLELRASSDSLAHFLETVRVIDTPQYADQLLPQASIPTHE